MEIINTEAEDYAARFTTPTDSLLQEIEKYTIKNHPHANMLSGPIQGKLLEMMSMMIKPKRILEIGTFMGYSALCLVKGLSADGQLHTIDIRKEDADIARNYFSKSLYTKQIILHVGNALDIIPTLNETWDLIFIDADKVNYINYYELTLPLLKKEGFILADNVLFHGEVLEENITGKNAKAIHAFNEHVEKDNRIQHVLLTVRDGLMLIQKK
ncbi:O-methyltransferase [Ginsengibacter hankyongi]|uniref:O-methyltransferase n=1 Tax=Ginsengibacter hankyongi TaxID=2607284 RepID=A0A5J5ILC0_9BACT|nr:O-methyltransferase [Ginsengibacter hankyongi]KAA9041521.1 O-methyltransferase [Ginsengibacter hankyongi]